MATIKVKWMYIDLCSSDTWKKTILPKIEAHGLTEDKLKRAVYVIRTNGNFAIDYPYKPSPTLYIGEGNFRNRIGNHRAWLKELTDLVGEFPIEVALAIPRARNNQFVYRDMEADLLHQFKSMYGMAPFLNQQMEYPKGEHEYEPWIEFVRPLQIGKGVRIPWALSPLPSNPQYDNYWKTAD
ncbi:hypothetical protein [Mariprofundus ferrooxydans]|uniref:hypothetical protein n=1 Tax=Mariprofundus ferrooxydans TaxID=314344 RepID=UPI001431E9AD|nr:hypothetical protein [Mariprofundus ferrooxydans]